MAAALRGPVGDRYVMHAKKREMKARKAAASRTVVRDFHKT